MSTRFGIKVDRGKTYHAPQILKVEILVGVRVYDQNVAAAAADQLVDTKIVECPPSDR